MLKDETEKVFYRLTVIARHDNYKDGSAQWLCQCKCGNTVVYKGAALRSGVAKSCGCYNIEAHTKHNSCFTPEYKSWQSAKDRCHNIHSKDYPRYGGRGIYVCDKWKNDFSAFYADMGKRPKYYSIGRIDNDGPYSPDNCRWESPIQQSNNRKSSKFVTQDGVTKSISEWAREFGLTPQAVSSRLKRWGKIKK